MKTITKSTTNVTLRLPLNMVGNNETNFLHNLLLTERQISSFCKADANHTTV